MNTSLLCVRTSLTLMLIFALISAAGCVSQEQELKMVDLEQRVTALKEQTTKLEQATTSLHTDTASKLAQFREHLNAQDMKMKGDQDLLRSGVNGRMNEVTGQVEQLRKEIMELVQKANAAVVKTVDERLDSIDVAIGAMLMRIEELEKRPSPAKK